MLLWTCKYNDCSCENHQEWSVFNLAGSFDVLCWAWLFDIFLQAGAYHTAFKLQCHFVHTAFLIRVAESANQVFDESTHNDVVAWTAIIDGVDQVTVVSVLCAAGMASDIWFGRCVHGFYVEARRVQWDAYVGSALLDMYMKCGYHEDACKVFNEMPVKNVVCWIALIAVTFIGVRSACSHGGLVDEGRKLFGSMKQIFHLEPTLDHYGCMVDLLGRAGYLEEARKMIEGMPMLPTTGVWGALLGACVIHKNFELGELVGNHLIKLQSNHSGRYILLSNFYSTWKKWEIVAGIRKLMKGKRVEKITGHSWIEVNGAIFEFAAFDKSHSESDNIYLMLDNMFVQLKLAGYVLDTHLLAFDIDGS
ncbi:hypothetical protein L3X38_002782 [Prunus dulcis]|uniref:Pentatricopeptide repeat-containing protein n=1 Tax=Prunus dulcis TaxID=3755 RepID=A0AAD4WZ38_PRUDU|nr:hypothetical protein L3X38_002782 [Prunus dulcis]